MPLSILLRSQKSSDLKKLVSCLNSTRDAEIEIIGVCKLIDEELNIKMLTEKTGRFGARIIGIENSTYDRILFLDTDQVPEKGLISELDKREEDMVIIPERSLRRDFVGRYLDDWRHRIERIAKKDPNPFIPVVPRFYKTNFLVDLMDKFPPETYEIVNHEDSVFYYEAFKKTQNVGFSIKHIYNDDGPFLTLMRKAFLYGRNSRDISLLKIPKELAVLLERLDKNSLKIREIGIGGGYVIQAFRGIAYEIGRAMG